MTSEAGRPFHQYFFKIEKLDFGYIYHVLLVFEPRCVFFLFVQRSFGASSFSFGNFRPPGVQFLQFSSENCPRGLVYSTCPLRTIES